MKHKPGGEKMCKSRKNERKTKLRAKGGGIREKPDQVEVGGKRKI